MSGAVPTVLSVGSNLGDRLAALGLVVAAVRAEPGVGLRAISPVYETAPVGGPDQADYLNAVLLVTGLGARAALELGQRCEEQAGRVRTEHWGPRTLDVDVVAVGPEVVVEPDLVVPHPRAHERAFVLVPWLDVDADAELPGHGRVAALLGRLDRSGVRPRPDLVLA